MKIKNALTQILCAMTGHDKCLDVDSNTGKWFDYCSLCYRRWENESLNNVVSGVKSS